MVDLDKLRRLYSFSKDVSISDVQDLLKSVETVSIKKRTVLIEQGSRDSRVYYLRSGLVRMYHLKDSGDEVTFDLIPEYNIVANFDLIGTEKPSNYNYETLEDSNFWSLEYEVFESIVHNNPKLEANRKYLLRKLLLAAKERLESFILLNPEERYLKFIKDYPDLTNRAPDKYIAQILGITPVSLSRIRKRITIKA